jgi:hypothetical protein
LEAEDTGRPAVGGENQSESAFAIWTVFILLSTHGCFGLLSLLDGASRAQATWVLEVGFNPRFPNAREPALADAGFFVSIKEREE